MSAPALINPRAKPHISGESAMIYIENEGALFRGLSRSFPKEVWGHKTHTWRPYTGEVPKHRARRRRISARRQRLTLARAGEAARVGACTAVVRAARST
jgi:hypothetical protein